MPEPVTPPPQNVNSPLASARGNHVAVRVPDLDVAKRWYIEKLDFRVMIEAEFGVLRVVYLAPPADDAFLVELLAGGTPAPRPKHTDLLTSLDAAGYHHYGMVVRDVQAVIAELRRRQVTIVGQPFDVVGWRLAFVADPWGIVIELAQALP